MLHQVHRPMQRPLTTAHLAQTMSLLSLTALELRQQIDQELSANPALEMLEERHCPTCGRRLGMRGACPQCSCPREGQGNEPVVFISPREDFYTGSGAGASSGMMEDEPEENYAAADETLAVYVFRQIAPDLQPEDRPLVAHLLTHLDEDGLLTETLAAMARYLHVPLSRMLAVQRLVQRAEPVGVGSADVEEALLAQLDVLSETHNQKDSQNQKDSRADAQRENGIVLSRRILAEGCLTLLSRRAFDEIAHGLQVHPAQVKQAARFISENLNPYPARSAWGETRSTPPAAVQVYYRPDMIITQQEDAPEGPLMVEIILPLAGMLRVNPLYKQALTETSGEKKDALRGDMDRANLFVKCIQQRNHTMQRLMQRVVSLQRAFLLKGNKYLRPVTRASLAIELGLHESTISRAVANKAVQIPNGRIIPLACFFDRSLNIRTVLRELIEQEGRPMSDSELVGKLAERGYNVARRTVAKYRAMEGILASGARQAG